MNKNVLILSASPRKGGNSETLCDAFARGAQEAGHTVRKVSLRDYQINYCTGCGSCFTTHRCVQNDDMKVILAEMIKADAIVMATPVYFYSMCADENADRPYGSRISGDCGQGFLLYPCGGGRR